jgi:outer membrane scaffolding protein for murein synthesis (MipA/OmpV family)
MPQRAESKARLCEAGNRRDDERILALRSREEPKMLRAPTISASGAALIGILAMSQAATAAEFTIGAGAGVRPDYQGSDDYEAVPLWNLRAGDLYHPETFVQLFGPRLTSNLLPHDHWRLGIAGQFIQEEVSTRRSCSA